MIKNGRHINPFNQVIENTIQDISGFSVTVSNLRLLIPNNALGCSAGVLSDLLIWQKYETRTLLYQAFNIS